jgi:hypothetical protein
MKVRFYMAGGLLALAALSSGCANKSPFPAEVRDKVSPTFDFTAWREAAPSNPGGKSDSGMKVELGGRIVQATKSGKGILIVAEQLPIVNRPAYGPIDSVSRKGEYEFAFLYPEDLSLETLKTGNRFVMVGTTSGRKPVVVNGAPKSEPYLVADCIHVWQPGRTEIADLKESAGAGNSPLTEMTSCAPKH